MIAIQDLSYEIGGRFLYREANWQISPGDRVGLVGKNGTGKSTLLRLIMREFTPTEGLISYGKDLKIGFLNQDLLSFESEDSILNIALLAFEEEKNLEIKINSLLDRLSTEYDNEQLLNELADAQERFEIKGGYEMEARTHEVLTGLGFGDEERHLPYSSFSGGWRMRVMLAQMLLRQPDVLLLDEPTNHLDLPSILWVENYLQSFKGAYVVVSHDRYFLDLATKQIVEVANNKLHHYDGNYTKFLLDREERRVLQQAAFDNQQKFIADTERFIERFKAKATKASQAQSRVKMLDKLDRVDAPESDEATMNMRFNVAKKSGVDVVLMEEIKKSFDSKKILQNTGGRISRGDKIGLIGANGMGKSTLLRIIAGTETYSGDVKFGHNVEATFFAQHQLEALDLNKSIWDEVYYSAPNKIDSQVRATLGCFLFSNDDIYKKIQVLSGGEKSRVALAKTLLKEANFLMLDEPTNHLDMQSIQILIEALKAYEGTFIVVSHDRYFLKEICNKIWYIENYQIKEYPGTYDEYDYWKSIQAKEETKNKDLKNTVKPNPDKANPPKPQIAKELPKSTNQSNNDSRSKVKQLSPDEKKRKNQLENQIKKAEQLVDSLEKQIKNFEEEMSKPEIINDFSKLRNLQKNHQDAQKQYTNSVSSWENLMIELETIE